MEVRVVKGTRDISGEAAIIRSRVVSTLKNIFEKYGFQPLFTPAIEYVELLKTKISDEMLGLIYEFKDKAGRDIGLRYDLTIGLARFAATNQIKLPFKRYQIERVWRYEKPQAGRYREFWQADIDILGVKSAKADAECLACISDALKTLNIPEFIIRVNSRKLLDELADRAGIEKEKRLKTYQIIDKIDKIGKNAVIKELKEFLGKARGEKFSNLIFEAKSIEKTSDLKELEKYAKIYGITFKHDITLARGLAYYTGLIYEINTKEYMQGKLTIAAGGRYDDLVEMLKGKSIAATGVSIGLDRICELLKDKGEKSITKIYVVPVSNDLESEAIRILQEFRKSNINADISFKKDLRKSLDYADKTGIPYVAFIGKEEGKGKVKIKNMKTGEEKIVSVKNAIKLLKH